MAEFFALLLIVFGIGAVMIAAWMVKAFVLVKLWLWFAVPVFHFAPLNYGQAIGITLITGLLATQYIKSVKTEDGSASGDYIVYLFIRPLFALLIGYIAKGYI